MSAFWATPTLLTVDIMALIFTCTIADVIYTITSFEVITNAAGTNLPRTMKQRFV